MKVFLDERCLVNGDLAALLRSWRQIADFSAVGTQGVLLFFDRDAATGNAGFLQHLNSLAYDLRVLYMPLVFGSRLVQNWRPNAMGHGLTCRLNTEHVSVVGGCVCEVYEHSQVSATVAMIGHHHSSYVNLNAVQVHKLVPPGATATVTCGTTLVDFQGIASAWHCLVVQYDIHLRRPPADHETVLGQYPTRFIQVGRFERNGRRNVYREIATNRLFYVDNLHYGIAAHLEVFDNVGRHLGVADLDGNLDVAGRVPGRTISW